MGTTQEFAQTHMGNDRSERGLARGTGGSGGRLEQGAPSLGMQSTKAISIEPHLPRFGYGRCSNLLECVCECLCVCASTGVALMHTRIIVSRWWWWRRWKVRCPGENYFIHITGGFFYKRVPRCFNRSQECQRFVKTRNISTAVCTDRVVSGWSGLRKHVWSACSLMIF